MLYSKGKQSKQRIYIIMYGVCYIDMSIVIGIKSRYMYICPGVIYARARNVFCYGGKGHGKKD